MWLRLKVSFLYICCGDVDLVLEVRGQVSGKCAFRPPGLEFCRGCNIISNIIIISTSKDDAVRHPHGQEVG